MNTHSSTVSVISDTDNTVVINVPVGQGPFGIVYDSVKEKSSWQIHSQYSFRDIGYQ